MSQESDNIIEAGINTETKLVVVLAGPTAVGKSDVAAKLCEMNRGIIVSADSVQAYRGVQIGANKPTEEELKKTPHLLVDVADHKDAYNAAEWSRDALYCIEKLLKCPAPENSDRTDDTADRRRKTIDSNIQLSLETKGLANDAPVLPIIVGGTMMYLQWLVHGRPDALRPTESVLQSAAKIIGRFQDSSDWQGGAELVGSKGDIYNKQVRKLAGRDWYRLRRILEVALTVEEKNDISLIDNLYTGEREGGLKAAGYDVRCFFLCPDERMKHTEVVDERCEQMIKKGLLSETSILDSKGCLPDMAAKAIGYRQTLEYLKDSASDGDEETAFQSYLEGFTTATRRYAKRQMQWFRKDKDFFFVPMQLDQEKTARVEATASLVSELLSLSRSDFDKTLTDVTGISHQTRQTNEKQGSKMKVYQFRRQLLKPGTEDLAKVLREAEECRKRKRHDAS